MGNQNKKIVLQSSQRVIVIDQKQGKTIWLNQLPVFPHGYDGLHIWEAGIVLSRHVLYNRDQFAGKTVLELGSGVGIGGLTVAKFTDCKKCVLSDYVPQIVDNIKTNAQKNKVQNKVEVMKINWLEHQKFDMQFDIVIGSDVVYFGCPVLELYNLIKKATIEGGIAQIIIPDRKNYAELFLQQIEANVFEVYKKKLQDPLYRQSPLPNKVDGLKQYNLLVDIDFYVYTLVKKTLTPDQVAQKQRLRKQQLQKESLEEHQPINQNFEKLDSQNETNKLEENSVSQKQVQIENQMNQKQENTVITKSEEKQKPIEQNQQIKVENQIQEMQFGQFDTHQNNTGNETNPQEQIEMVSHVQPEQEVIQNTKIETESQTVKNQIQEAAHNKPNQNEQILINESQNVNDETGDQTIQLNNPNQQIFQQKTLEQQTQAKDIQDTKQIDEEKSEPIPVTDQAENEFQKNQEKPIQQIKEDQHKEQQNQINPTEPQVDQENLNTNQQIQANTQNQIIENVEQKNLDLTQTQQTSSNVQPQQQTKEEQKDISQPQPQAQNPISEQAPKQQNKKKKKKKKKKEGKQEALHEDDEEEKPQPQC